MTLVEDRFSSGQSIRPYPRLVQNIWRAAAHQRLDLALATALPVPFDDTSRIIFLSDCHRGDGSSVDAFARNKAIYVAALSHYLEDDITYVEVGDGDELWQNGRFSDILDAHGDIFSLLHRFDRQGRLYLLVGNHDTYSSFRHQETKDEIPTHHSLRLVHQKTGLEILVAHGHQADLTSSRYYAITRMVCRSLWRWLQANGWVDGNSDPTAGMGHETPSQNRVYALGGQGKRIEQRIREWVLMRHVPVICGHTHLPALPGVDQPLYFNSGSCVTPGFLTGLELVEGRVTLVKWTLDADRRPVRQLLAHPRALPRSQPVALQ